MARINWLTNPSSEETDPPMGAFGPSELGPGRFVAGTVGPRRVVKSKQVRDPTP